MLIFNVADMKDPTDPEGRSHRQVNASKKHNIPIGALVETETGVRLFVVYHARDCDQTPLYSLCINPRDTIKHHPGVANRNWVTGYSEPSLTVINPDPQFDEEQIEIFETEARMWG